MILFEISRTQRTSRRKYTTGSWRCEKEVQIKVEKGRELGLQLISNE